MTAAAPVAAVIFDFDGVLADTEALHCAAFQAAAAEAGVAVSRRAYYRDWLGLPDRDCLAAACAAAGRALGAADLDGLVRRKRAHFARLSTGAALYPGVAPTLQRLHAACTLAIASGAFRDEIDAILARAAVRSLFAAVVAAEDVAAGKPAPDAYVRALAEINRGRPVPLSPADCLAVEDSPHGIAAARAAGMRCVAVRTSRPRAALAAADAVIAGVSALRPEDLQP